MSNPVSAERVIEDLRVEIFRKRISQEQLATKAGMSQSAISRRLNGTVSPTIDELAKLADAAELELQVTLTGRAS